VILLSRITQKLSWQKACLIIQDQNKKIFEDPILILKHKSDLSYSNNLAAIDPQLPSKPQQLGVLYHPVFSLIAEITCVSKPQRETRASIDQQMDKTAIK
jgi:hypothetical protein